MDCDRYWLLTWTTYGTWLPGDERGFVSNVADNAGRGVRMNTPTTPCVKDVRPLRAFAAAQVSEVVLLTAEQAVALREQFHETAAFRGWVLFAFAVMRNHVHIVVGVPGDPEPDTLLRDFKSYSSRRLNQVFKRRDRWWTQSGSRRKLPDEGAVLAAMSYVKTQEYPLVVWVRPEQSGLSDPNDAAVGGPDTRSGEQ
jgi:REP element-mobilizing transposase RayT